MADSTGSDDAVAGGRKNTIWGVEPSLVSDEELFTRVDSVVVSRATNEAIADRVTFSVIHRIRERIRHLIQTEACKMALQTGLALVVMDVIGAFPPCDLGDVEKVGNHIALQLTRRYVDQIKKIKRNVRKPEARAAQLQQLEAECWVPAGMLWTVPSKTQPRLRDSQVGRWDVSIESDMKMVLEENVQLKILAASAEHYAIRSEQSRERCTVEEARAREANLRASHAQQYLQEANDGLARERHRLQAAETKKRAALDRCKQAKAEVTRLQGRIAHLGGCVSRAVAEAGAEKRARDMLESDKQGDLERKVRQRVEEQVREELSAELKAAEAEVARMARLKNDMAKRKRSSDARARTSEKRLEARKVAEETVKHLRDELDGLYEDLRAAEEQARAAGLAAAAAMEATETIAREETSGKFKSYPWKLRLLIYRWLLRRTPPSAVGPNLTDAAQLLSPGLKIAVPSLEQVRRMRQEATLLCEAIAAYRIAAAKRIVSFGFDETSKMGDGLASTNFQIETQDGELCDEVLRGAFLIPGGCADQVARAMETKLFSRGRMLLDRVRFIYEAKHGERSWTGPKPAQLGYHRLAKSLIMSDTCTAARSAKQMIIAFAGDEVERVAREAGLWESMGIDEQENAVSDLRGDNHAPPLCQDCQGNSSSHWRRVLGRGVRGRFREGEVYWNH